MPLDATHGLTAEAVDDLRTATVDRLRAAGCVFAEEEAGLLLVAADAPEQLDAMVAQREEGAPLEHILGWAELCGVRVAVDRGVFVPRRRSELLVTEAARVTEAGDIVVELCCGSAAISVALASLVPGIELHAADIDPVAVRCAQRNLEPFRGHAYVGDLYEPLPRALQGRVDVLIANAPYVPTDDVRWMPREARLHESPVALDGGVDGLDVQRRVVAEVARWLRPGGHALIEASDIQCEQSCELFVHAGLDARVQSSDLLGATVVISMLPSDTGPT